MTEDEGLRASLPAKFQPIVAYALKRMPKLASTRDALKLAIEIANRLAALPKPQQPAKQDGPGGAQERQEGQDGPGEAQKPQEGQDGPGEAPRGTGAGGGGEPDLNVPPLEPDAGLDNLVYAFPVNAQVNDPAQLATEGLATLVRAIETGRNHTR